MKKLILMTVLLLGVGTAGHAQTTVANEPEKSKVPTLIAKLVEVELTLRLCSLSPTHESCKDRSPAQETAALYAEIVKDPEASKFLVSNALSSYSSMREGARSAMQVSQAADEAGVKMQLIIIAQNQRIIELLDQLVKKK